MIYLSFRNDPEITLRIKEIKTDILMISYTLSVFNWSIDKKNFIISISVLKILERSKYSSVILHNNCISNIFIVKLTTNNNIRNVSDQNRYSDDLMHTFDHQFINRRNWYFIPLSYVSKILPFVHHGIDIIKYSLFKSMLLF